MTREKEAPHSLRRDSAGLLLIDAQQPLLDAMWNRADLVANLRRLVEGARILGLRVLATEQNPARLGPTAKEVAEVLGDAVPMPKMTFSCCRDRGVLASLERASRNVWLVCGVEAHVCVSQTALDLLARGYRVHVAADAVGSRARENWEAGLARARESGAVITSTEMALFELLETAEAPEFKAVHRLVR